MKTILLLLLTSLQFIAQDSTFFEIKKLLASGGQAEAEFGQVVALGEDVAIVGCPNLAEVYVYYRDENNPDSWSEVKIITPFNSDTYSSFGSTLDIDGEYLIVGDPRDSEGIMISGAVYIFQKDEGGPDNWGLIKKIKDKTPAKWDEFGESVSIDKGTAVVGVPSKEIAGVKTGVAYVYSRDFGGINSWERSNILQPSDYKENIDFGFSVTIEGDNILIGAPFQDHEKIDEGVVYVYSNDSTDTNQWNFVRQLTPEVHLRDNRFGWSLSLDKEVAVIGALGVFGLPYVGSAYIFYQNQGGENNWGQVKHINPVPPNNDIGFGSSVSVSRDKVVLGEFGEFGGGAAYVYQKDAGGTDNWGETQQLKANDNHSHNMFGRSVSMNNNDILIGAPRDNELGSSAGAAYVFEYNFIEIESVLPESGSYLGGTQITIKGNNFGDTTGTLLFGEESVQEIITWTDTTIECYSPEHFLGYVDIKVINNDGLSDTLTNGFEFIAEVPEIDKIWANDARNGDEFGYTVAINGNYAVVGSVYNDAAGRDAGAVYIFKRSSGNPGVWNQIKKLTAPDADDFDGFGFALSISGDHILVGAYKDDEIAENCGAAYLYNRDQGGSDNWGLVKKIMPSNGASKYRFGFSVAICGENILIGATINEGNFLKTGAAYFYNKNEGGENNWGEVRSIYRTGDYIDGYGYSVAIDGNYAVVGTLYDDNNLFCRGSVYIHHKHKGGENNWGEVKVLTENNQTSFGHTVSISGNSIAVGCYSSRIYLYKQNAGGENNWGMIKYRDNTADYFGNSISLKDNYLVVGARAENSHKGAAFLYYKNSGGENNWGMLKKLSASDGENYDSFGWSVAIDNNSVLIGTPGEDEAGTSAGAAYIYDLQLPITSVNNFTDHQMPHSFALGQNYPNPFNPVTNINFTIPADGTVSLEIYNILGEKVSTLINQVMKQGIHIVRFNGSNLASGIYIYALKHNGKFTSKKMMLLK